MTTNSSPTDKTPLPREGVQRSAGRAVLCSLLYGPRVVRTVRVQDGDVGEVSTYSAVPVPASLRPRGERGRRESSLVTAEAIVDAAGVVAYAGLAAQSLWRERVSEGEEDETSPDESNELAAREDREALARLGATLGVERPVERFYADYWSEARRLLSTHWDAVTHVASVLATRGELPGDRVDLVVHGDTAV